MRLLKDCRGSHCEEESRFYSLLPGFPFTSPSPFIQNICSWDEKGRRFHGSMCNHLQPIRRTHTCKNVCSQALNCEYFSYKLFWGDALLLPLFTGQRKAPVGRNVGAGCEYSWERQFLRESWACSMILTWVCPLVPWNYSGCSIATWGEVSREIKSRALLPLVNKTTRNA